jgi:hypothetical protein
MSSALSASRLRSTRSWRGVERGRMPGGALVSRGAGCVDAIGTKASAPQMRCAAKRSSDRVDDKPITAVAR